MNKNFAISLATLTCIALLSAGYYFWAVVPSTTTNMDVPKPVVTPQEMKYDSRDFSWSYVAIPKPNPTGIQDFPTYTLILSVGGKSYQINDYWKGQLYGCNMPQDRRPQGTETSSDAISDHLCYVIAAGDLFTVVKSEEGYTVRHELVGDVEKGEPTNLFTIK